MSELQHALIDATPFMPRLSADTEQLFTPVAPRRAFQADFSSTGAADAPLWRQFETSRTLGELQQDPIYGRLWQPASEQHEAEPSPLEVARNQRLAILARKYEGTVLTREDEARVAILTQRLRRLAPRVTKLSWTIAEEAVAALEEVATSVDEIGAKYGL